MQKQDKNNFIEEKYVFKKLIVPLGNFIASFFSAKHA